MLHLLEQSERVILKELKCFDLQKELNMLNTKSY